MISPFSPFSPFRPWLALVLLLALLWGPEVVQAAPGLCLGPVCADQITRSVEHPWQLRVRVDDQQGHRERLVVDCRDGRLSPALGPVERGHASALARRPCRLAGEA